MSNIPKYTQNIDTSYPVKGLDNAGAGFRDNFAQTRLALDTAAGEMTSQQILYSVIVGTLDTTSTSISAILAGKADLVNSTVKNGQLALASTATTGTIQLINSYLSSSTTRVPTANAVRLVNDYVTSTVSSKANLTYGMASYNELPKASVTNAGIVQLYNSYIGTYTNLAPTSLALYNVTDYLTANTGLKADLIGSVANPAQIRTADVTANGYSKISNVLTTAQSTVLTQSAVFSEYAKINSTLTQKTDLVGGKVPISELPVSANGVPGAVQLMDTLTSNSTTATVTSNVLKTLSDTALGAVSAIQSGSASYAVSSGINNYTASYSPPITQIQDGLVLTFKASNTNTGASTFSPNGLPAYPIVDGTHQPIIAGTIVANGDAWIQWNSSLNGGKWVLVESSGAIPTERVYTTSSGALSLANGTIQTINMTSNVSLSLDLTSGQKMSIRVIPNGFTLDVSGVTTSVGFTLDPSNTTVLLAVNIAGINYVISSASYAPKIIGGLWVWGIGTYSYNSPGVLPVESGLTSSPIQLLPSITEWRQLSGSNNSIMMLKTDGTLWGWGYNYYGQLGDNTSIYRSSPVQIVTGGSWRQIAHSAYHTAAIKSDGTLWTWGYNYYGQLGDNTIGHKSSPVQTIAAGSNWKQVACGTTYTAAIKTDGTLWSWGRGDTGTLGINGLSSKVRSPVQELTGGTDWKQVSCGFWHTAAIKTNGTLWLWGQNNYGQLGTGSSVPYTISSPVQTIAGGTNWVQVACGVNHTVALKSDGSLWGWGRNASGQLGTGNTTGRNSPVQTVSGGKLWAQVGAIQDSTIAIKTDGTLWTWGYNGGGQLGDGTTVNRLSPVQTVAGGTGWKQVISSTYSTLAIAIGQ